MGDCTSSLVPCCSGRDKFEESVIPIHPACGPAHMHKMDQVSWGSSVHAPTRRSHSGSQSQLDERLKKAVQLSLLKVKADGPDEKAWVLSPKVQDYREAEQLGPAAELAANAANHSAHSYAPVTALVPLPAQQQHRQPVQDSNGGALPSALALERIPLAISRPNDSDHLGDDDCARTASNLEVPDPPLAAPKSSQLSLRHAVEDGDSRLPQPPSTLDGEATACLDVSRQAPLRWRVNSIDNLSDGLASKFQELQNKGATGSIRRRNSTGCFEPAQLEDRLASRFEQQRAKERAGKATSVVSVDGARAARRSDGIAIVDKVLEERLARQRLKAEGR